MVINKGILICFKKINYNAIILKDELNLLFKCNNNCLLIHIIISINKCKHLSQLY